MRVPNLLVGLALAAVIPAPALYAQTGQSSQGSGAPQTSSPSNQPGVPSAGSLPDSNGGSALADRAFLHKAAAGGLAEIQLGQLASQKASSDDVKAFGQHMVMDHTQLNDELKPFAQQKGATIPKKLSKKDQALYDKLNGMSGDAFDKAYLSAMVKDHQEDAKDFQTEANATTDPQLKATVQKGSEVIQQHLTAVEQLAKEKGATDAAGGQ